MKKQPIIFLLLIVLLFVSSTCIMAQDKQTKKKTTEAAEKIEKCCQHEKCAACVEKHGNHTCKGHTELKGGTHADHNPGCCGESAHHKTKEHESTKTSSNKKETIK